MKKTLTILTTITISFTALQASGESCVSQYEAAQKQKPINAVKGVSAVGACAIGTVALTAFTLIGGAVLLVFCGPGAVYVVYREHEANKPINEEVKVLTLYEQAKSFVDGHKTRISDMDMHLQVVVKGVAELVGEKKDSYPESLQLSLPQEIVTLMESGRLCEKGLTSVNDLITKLKEPSKL